MAELAGDAAPTTVATMTPSSVMAATPTITDAELDKSILNYAILNGALELLPQSWASMAIIPLQIKMVYSIGKTHGYLRFVIGRIAEHPVNQVAELLPWAVVKQIISPSGALG